MSRLFGVWLVINHRGKVITDIFVIWLRRPCRYQRRPAGWRARGAWGAPGHTQDTRAGHAACSGRAGWACLLAEHLERANGADAVGQAQGDVRQVVHDARIAARVGASSSVHACAGAGTCDWIATERPAARPPEARPPAARAQPRCAPPRRRGRAPPARAARPPAPRTRCAARRGPARAYPSWPRRSSW